MHYNLKPYLANWGLQKILILVNYDFIKIYLAVLLNDLL